MSPRPHSPTRKFLDHGREQYRPEATEAALLWGLMAGGMLAGALRYLPPHLLRLGRDLTLRVIRHRLHHLNHLSRPQ